MIAFADATEFRMREADEHAMAVSATPNIRKLLGDFIFDSGKDFLAFPLPATNRGS
jgi:hypothetical protein